MFAVLLPSLLGLAILGSYAHVFRAETAAYTESVYWLGMDVSAVNAVVVLYQLPAAVGFLAWSAWAYGPGAHSGLLTYKVGSYRMRDVVVNGTLFGSLLWPWTLPSHKMMATATATLPAKLLTCSTLWITAVGSILLVAGTFEARNATRVPVVGITAFSAVTVLVDGVGWAARYLVA